MQKISGVLVGAPVNPQLPAKRLYNDLSAGAAEDYLLLKIDVLFQVFRRSHRYIVDDPRYLLLEPRVDNTVKA